MKDQRICRNCGKSFTFFPIFFQKRGFNPPKRCNKCIGEGKGRNSSEREKKCLVDLSNVELDLPLDLIKEGRYLKRKDDRMNDKEYISCFRFKFDLGEKQVTFYDQRNKEPEEIVFWYKSNASVRIMEITQDCKKYQYIVLDSPEVITVSEKYKLCVSREEVFLESKPDWIKKDKDIIWCCLGQRKLDKYYLTWLYLERIEGENV